MTSPLRDAESATAGVPVAAYRTDIFESLPNGKLSRLILEADEVKDPDPDWTPLVALSELDTARAEIERLTRDVNKYAYERDKAREERDAAELRSEAFWKPQVVRLERLEKMVRVFLDNNPDELVADSGETVLDLFRYQASATLSPVKENDRAGT